jgi:hypothetical protein
MWMTTIHRRQAKTWLNPVFGPGNQIGFWLAAFVIGWFIGRLRQRRRERRRIAPQG